MTIKTIKASSSMEGISSIGLKKWAGFEIMAELADGENPDAVKNELVETLRRWHGENGFEVMVDYSTVPTHPMQVKEEPKSPIEALIQDIMNETVLRKEDGTGGLLSWEKIANSNPVLKEAYDAKLKELQNK